MKKLWTNYGLSIVLLILFSVSWIGQGYFQWQEFAQEEMQEGRASALNQKMEMKK
jgi:hypothetical protein